MGASYRSVVPVGAAAAFIASARANPGAVMKRGCLASALTDYRRRWPVEAVTVDAFERLLREAQEGGPNPFQRARHEGHFTGSAWLISADEERVLLTHHRKLDRWLQLGGHADGDTDLARVALREAAEESGLTALVVETEIYDLDRHWIPWRDDAVGHWHYDVRFVVRATTSERHVANEESHELAWRRITEIAEDEAADVSLRRMALRWLERHRSAGNGE
jgi:8-oxo-dGTP pyrophosphatase MutT (NUDIX family)